MSQFTFDSIRHKKALKKETIVKQLDFDNFYSFIH